MAGIIWGCIIKFILLFFSVIAMIQPQKAIAASTSEIWKQIGEFKEAGDDSSPLSKSTEGARSVSLFIGTSYGNNDGEIDGGGGHYIILQENKEYRSDIELLYGSVIKLKALHSRSGNISISLVGTLPCKSANRRLKTTKTWEFVLHFGERREIDLGNCKAAISKNNFIYLIEFQENETFDAFVP